MFPFQMILKYPRRQYCGCDKRYIEKGQQLGVEKGELIPCNDNSEYSYVNSPEAHIELKTMLIIFSLLSLKPMCYKCD